MQDKVVQSIILISLMQEIKIQEQYLAHMNGCHFDYFTNIFWVKRTFTQGILINLLAFTYDGDPVYFCDCAILKRSLLATIQKGCVFTQKMYRFFDQLIRFNQSVVVLERSRTRFKKFQTDQRVFFAIFEILTFG